MANDRLKLDRTRQIANSLTPFGETIFTEMSRLAMRHNAVNLGQGFPNFDGPEFVKQAAIQAINAGHGQYARMFGLPELNKAIAERFAADSGLPVDSEAQVTVTSGCTEAIASALLGLVNPGDEVILFEPYYDSYRACVAMAGAVPRFVTLRPPDFSINPTELRRAFSSKTRAILINTPQNPTGKVFRQDELEAIAQLCREHDVIALSDEVYERLVFEGRHISIASLAGMPERTVTLSSLGKTFSLTGWKIGWAIAAPDLTAGIRAAHQFLTFATATPLQHGAIAALRAPNSYYEQLVGDYRRKRDALVVGLSALGFQVFPPQGTYFVMADHTPFGFESDVAFCRHLIERVGVAAIPTSVFYHNPSDGRSLVRFAFCKTDETLREGLRRMSALQSAK
ncbi:MAG: aminotransferase class I/II-fold pyridoxal phosphate-dependent enzyme [Phycisphaerales bacterium]|nr:aminotransferase class I/II-fold pyridoxal phosphate-dependent enzyme [Phycisphaerales bacterium]MCI0631423.1 aminotransferase class I/II-fold pyridoxal phosphate-dependent enzyme [Phycisphaerales bacterium]MCI0676967.1 aminotransferase class I/II-fold pyridoxal phosphate-dependent enzyme [Phycisphaerales bacterium]